MGGTCIWESLWFALRRSVGENIFGEFGKSIYNYYCRDALDKSFWMVYFLFTLDQKNVLAEFITHWTASALLWCCWIVFFIVVESRLSYSSDVMSEPKKSLSGASQLSHESFQSFEEGEMTLDRSCFEREWNISQTSEYLVRKFI